MTWQQHISSNGGLTWASVAVTAPEEWRQERGHTGERVRLDQLKPVVPAVEQRGAEGAHRVVLLQRQERVDVLRVLTRQLEAGGVLELLLGDMETVELLGEVVGRLGGLVVVVGGGKAVEVLTH